ncbi:MAG: UDP-3-O-(3-hydroxymyristoyl)glucosamine N-acyltransferase [Nitrospiraceae bacterium]|nr:UDP-3-O-(3-hydroxymyristoyl)glucosamine N-acyltransferase [Nitrospiraceae bacterium]
MKLSEIERLLGGRLYGDPEAEITGAAGIEDAGPGDVTFLLKPSLLPQAAASRAACVLVKDRLPVLPKSQLAVPDPQIAFIRLLELFYPPSPRPAGTSPGAVIGGGAHIDPGAAVLPFVFIEEGARVGRGSVLYPGVFVGRGSEIGRDCTLYPNVTVRERVRIGDRVVIHPGSVIGADGFGYVMRAGEHVKIPQVGGVVIEDDVEIGACATIDRASTGSTFIGRGTKIDNLVQIAHNVRIGPGSIIVAQAGIAGSSTLGSHVVIAGQAGVADHVSIAEGCIVGANSGVMPGTRLEKGAYAGSPVLPHRQWLKAMVLTARLPELEKRLRTLERRFKEDGDDERKGD